MQAMDKMGSQNRPAGTCAICRAAGDDQQYRLSQRMVRGIIQAAIL